MRIRILRRNQMIVNREELDLLRISNNDLLKENQKQYEIIKIAEKRLDELNLKMEKLNKKYQQLSEKYKSALTAKNLQCELNLELSQENQRLKKSNAGYKGTIVKFQKREK